MTLERSQELFAQAEIQLQQARFAIDVGQYGECERLAYQASETVAAGYLAKLGNDPALPSGNSFQLFVDSIWDAGTTPEATQEIRGAVGDVVVLREAHAPNLLHETTKADAKMMFERVSLLLSVVPSIQV